ncbi:class II fructose-bisphosphate aldolase [Steroidobacter sp. S1-65]|uniref:Class II fructose-bisphosphate aldolase n=1 Tax=Steroidobacter gossypii TaxID=2805490 RepID=A0ABS1X349_9GAMM|nr:class II fructose-bisphosphate aldolase [Steroidobacter gossypii]MBM0107648.1 class II fructose-bisphosphate aldolase [Steroidobacter gossypii]
MSLEPINRLMQHARHHDYAVGYFESWSFESVQGVIDAAQATRSPVIIGFNGEWLAERQGASTQELRLYAALGKAAAMDADVPVGLIFNECPNDAWVEHAIGAGFNLVMPADPEAPLDDYMRRVKRLATLAHSHQVAVEADFEADELDPIAYADGAARFVAETGVDLLAVSVGNEEIKLQGRAPLDLNRLEAVGRRLDVPLVLHGGTGIEDDSIRAAIHLGVRKINYGTYMKQKYLEVIRGALATDEPNPHALLGDGSNTDLMVVGRRVVRDAVLERIELLGCCGKV